MAEPPWHIKMEELTKAFDDAHLPEDARRTQFLGRTLIRQEMQPNGQWGPDMVIPDLPGEELMAIPADVPAPTGEQWAFVKWAQENAQLIMQPAFLQQVQQTGTMWYAPGTQPPPEEGVRPVIAAAPPPSAAAAPRAGHAAPPPAIRTRAMATRISDRQPRPTRATAPAERPQPSPNGGFKYPQYGGTRGTPDHPAWCGRPVAAAGGRGAPQAQAPAGMNSGGCPASARRTANLTRPRPRISTCSPTTSPPSPARPTATKSATRCSTRRGTARTFPPRWPRIR